MAGLPSSLETLLQSFDDRISRIENRKSVSRVANSAGDLIIPGTVQAAELDATRVRLAPAYDASLTSTGHNFQVGTDDGTNLIIDNNEIIVRQAGSGAALYINTDGGGGNVTLGTTANTITIPGLFNNPNLPLLAAVGQVSTGQTIATGGSVPLTITFPSGRFTRGPVLMALATNSRLTVGSSATTTSSGGTLNVSNWSTGNAGTANIWWLAIQMSSGNSFG